MAAYIFVYINDSDNDLGELTFGELNTPFIDVCRDLLEQFITEEIYRSGRTFVEVNNSIKVFKCDEETRSVAIVLGPITYVGWYREIERK